MVWINCGLDEAVTPWNSICVRFCLCSTKACRVLFGLEDGLFEQLPIQHRTKRTSANWTIILLNIQLLNIHLSRNYKIIVEKMNVKKLNVELTTCWIGILGNWLDGKSQMLNWLFVQYFLVNMTCSNAFVGSPGHPFFTLSDSIHDRDRRKGRDCLSRHEETNCRMLHIK